MHVNRASLERISNRSIPILQKYHLSHHYRVASLGFGVTSPLWDKVFGTFPSPSKLNAKR